MYPQADILQIYLQNAPVCPRLFLPISAQGTCLSSASSLQEHPGPKLAKDLKAQRVTLSFHLPCVEECLTRILGPDNQEEGGHGRRQDQFILLLNLKKPRAPARP